MQNTAINKSPPFLSIKKNRDLQVYTQQKGGNKDIIYFGNFNSALAIKSSGFLTNSALHSSEQNPKRLPL